MGQMAVTASSKRNSQVKIHFVPYFNSRKGFKEFQEFKAAHQCC